jgi:DNA-binding response OmpR family regulator
MTQNSILIVDDDKDVGAFLKDLLSSWGFQASYAEDGVSAMFELHRKKADLLILDYEMPGGNGMEIYERLRANSKFNDLPILFISAHSFSQIDPKIRQIAHIRFLNKPIDPEKLRKNIQELLHLTEQPKIDTKPPNKSFEPDAQPRTIIDLDSESKD